MHRIPWNQLVIKRIECQFATVLHNRLDSALCIGLILSNTAVNSGYPFCIAGLPLYNKYLP